MLKLIFSLAALDVAAIVAVIVAAENCPSVLAKLRLDGERPEFALFGMYTFLILMVALWVIVAVAKYL